MAARKQRRRTKDEVAAQLRAAAEVKVVQWAESYGAPVALLVGWDPATGKWETSSPVGMMIALVQSANFPTVAARLAGVNNLSGLLAKGNEYMLDLPEDRDYIPIEVRPFIDLVRQMDIAESFSEQELVDVVRKGSMRDPKLALAFLSRRYGSRWREQQTIFTGEDVDERDKAVSEALQDPNTAMALAAVAHRIQDATPTDV